MSADDSNYDLRNVEYQSLTPNCKISSRSPRFAKGAIANISDVLKARILLQRLCKQHCGWDEEVSQDYANAWQEWLQTLPTLSSVSIERCFIPPDFQRPIRCALHHFAYASTSGYVVVTYLRVVDNDGKIYCLFVMGKTCLAPLKAATVPRLELQAATLATRQDQFLRRELDIELSESTFWSDSTAVLLSINNTSKRFPTFVANRLSKIEAASRPGQWKYVPTNVNPADEGSRGSNAREFVSRSRWLKAPKFLWEKADSWPESAVDMPPLPTEYDEVKVKPVFVQSIDSTSLSERLMAYYSSWLKLRNAVAWFHRFAEFLRSHNRPHCCGSLTCDDLSGNETAILRFVQQQTFKQEIGVTSRCADQKRSCKRDLKGMGLTRSLFKLNPVLVDETIRVGGRLQNAPVGFDQKHPIILPHSHHVTDLIIRFYHNELHHVGASHTWAALRQRFWVIKGGVAVRRVLGQCVLCRKRGASIGQQVMADLPRERTAAHQPPFSHVGVDFFGPFMAKQGGSSIKCYGCIFSCLTVRAVHIEVTQSLSTNSFLDAFRGSSVAEENRRKF